MGELGRVGRVVATLGLGAALLLAGCGNDDGAGVRGGGSASASGSATGSGAGSGSGLAGQDLSGTTNDPRVQKAVADYKTWVVAEARRQFAPSRVRWERIEPIAGLVEEIDGKVDARVDDFEGVDDPQFTGWHRLEYHLWKLRSTEGTRAFADQLDKDIATLDRQIKGLEFPPAAVALGPAELIEEVSEGKITGEEDRYSHTDLSDFDANVDGSRKLFQLLTPALQAKDAARCPASRPGSRPSTRAWPPTPTPTGPSTPTPPWPPPTRPACRPSWPICPRSWPASRACSG
jgi:iron uptake system component EfeO